MTNTRSHPSSSPVTRGAGAWLLLMAMSGYAAGAPGGPVGGPAPVVPPVAPQPIASPYVSSWLGNTFDGVDQDSPADQAAGNVPDRALVPDYIQGIAVGADGTVYTNARGDENYTPVRAFKDGGFVMSAQGDVGPPYDSICQTYLGKVGSEAIAVNSSFVYSIHNSYDVVPLQNHFLLARRQTGASLNKRRPRGKYPRRPPPPPPREVWTSAPSRPPFRWGTGPSISGTSPPASPGARASSRSARQPTTTSSSSPTR